MTYTSDDVDNTSAAAASRPAAHGMDRARSAANLRAPLFDGRSPYLVRSFFGVLTVLRTTERCYTTGPATNER